MASYLGRRKFLAALGGAAFAWTLGARAQQPAMPVVGFLDSRSSDGMASRLAAFRQGLKEVGLMEARSSTAGPKIGQIVCLRWRASWPGRLR
jgi:hypothetical protein